MELGIAYINFLNKATQQAEQAGHIYPTMAACEAALESNYGTSALAILANNLFGMKAHIHTPTNETISLPTKEFIDGTVISIEAVWCKYPDQAACFTDRVNTLKRLAPTIPHYAAALAATNPIDYVQEVSKSWSTDPARANKVITIYIVYTAIQGNT